MIRANKKQKLNSDIELAKYLGFENRFCIVEWDANNNGLIYSIVNKIKIIGPFSINIGKIQIKFEYNLNFIIIFYIYSGSFKQIKSLADDSDGIETKTVKIIYCGKYRQCLTAYTKLGIQLNKKNE